MKLYTVAGYEHPLMLSEDHANEIGAVEFDANPTPPARNASVEAWREFAVGSGAVPEAVASFTRAELIAAYGD